MSKLKPCPFCGKQPVMTTDDNPQVYCDIRNCAGPVADSVTEWQTRPIEDALTANIAELEAELAAAQETIADQAAQLGAARWTKLTEDPATWPPADRSYVLGRRKDGGYEVTRSAWMVEEWHLYFRWVRLPEYEEAEDGTL